MHSKFLWQYIQYKNKKQGKCAYNHSKLFIKLLLNTQSSNSFYLAVEAYNQHDID